MSVNLNSELARWRDQYRAHLLRLIQDAETEKNTLARELKFVQDENLRLANFPRVPPDVQSELEQARAALRDMGLVRQQLAQAQQTIIVNAADLDRYKQELKIYEDRLRARDAEVKQFSQDLLAVQSKLNSLESQPCGTGLADAGQCFLDLQRRFPQVLETAGLKPLPSVPSRASASLPARPPSQPLLPVVSIPPQPAVQVQPRPPPTPPPRIPQAPPPSAYRQDQSVTLPATPPQPTVEDYNACLTRDGYYWEYDRQQCLPQPPCQPGTVFNRLTYQCDQQALPPTQRTPIQSVTPATLPPRPPPRPVNVAPTVIPQPPETPPPAGVPRAPTFAQAVIPQPPGIPRAPTFAQEVIPQPPGVPRAPTFAQAVIPQPPGVPRAPTFASASPRSSQTLPARPPPAALTFQEIIQARTACQARNVAGQPPTVYYNNTTNQCEPIPTCPPNQIWQGQRCGPSTLPASPPAEGLQGILAGTNLQQTLAQRFAGARGRESEQFSDVNGDWAI